MNANLFEYTLRLADTAIINGHRLSQWCGHGPILEEDIAITNIALDFIGLGNNLLEYAASIANDGRTADDLAFKRSERDYKNALLVEQPNGDYAKTIAREFFLDVYMLYYYEQLAANCKDEQLKAIAVKALKEIQYHVRHTSQWVLRMGDGTEESHNRIQSAINELWMYTGDLFDMDAVDQVLIEQGIAVDTTAVKVQWDKYIQDTLQEATLTVPLQNYMQKGSREGKHSEHLGFLLAEMQYIPRMYPEAKW